VRPDSGIATSAAGAQSNPLADPGHSNRKERKEREEELFLFTPLAFFAFEVVKGVPDPGETKDFANPSGPIWNNSSSDPGALYNQNGQLVSYYPD